MSSNVDTERDLAELFGESIANAAFDEVGFGKDCCAFGLAAVEVHGAFAGHAPHFLAVEDGLPVESQFAQCGVGAGGPAGDVDEEGCFGESLVGSEVIERIAGEESLHGLCEMIFECDVDAANGAVEVDGAEQIGAGFR